MKFLEQPREFGLKEEFSHSRGVDPTSGIDTKASYGSDVRRLVFDPALRFAGLRQESKTRLDESMKVRFKDNEGELCMITSDEGVRVPSQLLG